MVPWDFSASEMLQNVQELFLKKFEVARFRVQAVLFKKKDQLSMYSSIATFYPHRNLTKLKNFILTLHSMI
jgi:hypothetical protein